MSEQLTISGSLKENSFLKLKKFNNIKYLEISYANLNDDWKLIGDLDQLKSISVKDSLIDFQSFYKALSDLKKLEKITYNYYCYFNKKPKEELKKIEINNKIFQIDFPKKNELNFDYNNYMKETYKNKFHSIFEIKNSHKVFKNLSEISFTNFGTFKKYTEIFDSADKNYINKNFYWGMESSTLKKFKSLKNIKINNGSYMDILEFGLEKYLEEISKKKLPVALNKHFKPLNYYPKDLNLLNIIYSTDSDQNNFIFENKYELEKKIEEIKVHKYALTINEKNLIKDNGYNKAFTFLKNKRINKILNHKFDHIIFSGCHDFLDNKNTHRDGLKKIEIYLNLLKEQNIQNIFFDISKSSSYTEWSSSNFSFLIKFIYEINNKFPNITFYLYHKELNQLLKDIQSSDKFEKHLAYLINSMNLCHLHEKVKFIGADKNQLNMFLKNYINKGVDQIVVVDDFLYDAAKTLPDLALIYGEDLDDIKHKFPKYNEQEYYEKRWKNINFSLKEIFYEILRIAGFSSDNFQSDNTKLSMLVKKNYLEKLDNLKFKKVFYYLGSPLHLITHNMEPNRKNWNIKKNFNLLKPNDGIQKKDLKDKIFNYAKKSLTKVEQSKDIDPNKIKIDEKIFDAQHYEILKDIGINTKSFQNLTHLWIEGVVPWQQKYIKLSKLDAIIPTKRLENLRLSDCIYFRDLELPLMKNLKVLELHPNTNHHYDENDENKLRLISGFENCPNLEKLKIKNLNNFNNKKYFPLTLGSTLVEWELRKDDNFSIIRLDLNRLNELTKLEDLEIEEIQASNVREIKFIPNLKKISLQIFHNTKDDYLSTYTEEKEVTDKDLLFFKDSKKINDINLSIGSIIDNEEPSTGQCYSSYDGNGDFIEYINYKIENLTLSINFNFKNQIKIQDIITKVTNRFLNLKKLTLRFSIAVTTDNFNFEENKYFKPLAIQTIDFSKFAKLKKLTDLSFMAQDTYSFLKFKTINFDSIANLKKIKNIEYCWSSLSLTEFRKARIALKNENYDNPEYYDSDYEYYAEENENYKKNWSRMTEINSEYWDWYSLESRFIDLEKKENKKKFEKKTIIQKKKN